MRRQNTLGVPKIFLSYSHEDRALVQRLADGLLSNGFPIYVDRYELLPGESIRQEIERQIADTDIFVVALSRSSVRSEWVREEIDLMFQAVVSSGAVIVPFLLEECRIPRVLSTRVVIRADRDFDNALGELVMSIREWAERRRSLYMQSMTSESDSRPRLTRKERSRRQASVAQYAMNTGDLVGAESLLRQSVTAWGGNWDAHQLLAATLMKLDKTSEAQEILEALLERGVQKARSHYNLACMYSIRAESSSRHDAVQMTAHLARCFEHLKVSLSMRMVFWLARYGGRTDPVGDILTDPDLEFAARTSEDVGRLMKQLVKRRGQRPPDRNVYGGGGGCFEPDTPVRLPTGGSIPISHIRCGDLVSSVDDQGNEAVSEVVERIRNWEGSGVRINGRLCLSTEQTLMTPQGWRRAADLRCGMEMLVAGGRRVAVETVETWKAQRILWQLGLAGHPVFFAHGVLVHNAKDLAL